MCGLVFMPWFRDVTLLSRTAAAWPSDWCGVCHGAHFGEGPVLAILAMLARKSALRVAPGGSAPPIPSVARRGSGGARSGRESRLADRTGKRVLRYRRPDKQVPDRPPGGGIFWVPTAASHRAPIAKVTRLREHSGEAMPGPFGSISG
jgi:hypothetical protein